MQGPVPGRNEANVVLSYTMTTEDTRGLDPRAECGCKMVKVLDRCPFAKGLTGGKSTRKRGCG